jgi:DNA-binding SARP family transcriptional activator
MIRLRTLGHCVFEVCGHSVTPESDILFAVLLLLTSKAGHPVPRAEVLTLLWPESNADSARHRLRQAIYQLRKLGVPLHTSGSAVLIRKSDVVIDYLGCGNEFESFLESLSEPPQFHVLPQYSPAFSKPFAEWVEAERDRVQGQLRRRLFEGALAKRDRGDHRNAIVFARACVELDPLNDEVVFALAESLAIVGATAEALSVVDRFRDEIRALGENCSKSLLDLRLRLVESAKRSPRDSTAKDRLVGRESLVRQIESWVCQPQGGREIVAITGDAGIGKTRLLSEASRIARLHGALVVEHRSPLNGEGRPLVALLDLLPQFLSLPGAIGCQPRSFSRLTSLARESGASISVPSDTTDSAFRFALLRRAVLDLLEAVLSETDVILALDDAHALDRPSLDILLDASQQGGHSLAIIAAMRPVGKTAEFLTTRSNLKVIRVPRLEPNEARLILTGGQPVAANLQCVTLVDWAVDLAGGNPFFLTELSSHCQGRNLATSLPQSLHVALEQKIESLTSVARLVLQACAVLSENTTLPRLELMLGLPPHAIASSLSELELAGLIRARDGWVGCRHDLIADTVTRTLGIPLGTYLHRRCAVVLDRELEHSRGQSLAWDCVRHWEAADEPSRALDLTGLIVDRLLGLGLPAAAADLCARAEKYCREPDQHASRLLWLSRAQRLLYDWDGVVASLERRRAILHPSSSRSHRYSEEETWLLEARWWRGCDSRTLGRAHQRVRDRRSPAIHRLEMAAVGLIVADNQRRRSAAEQIYEAVEQIVPNNANEGIARTRATLIFHTAFGDLEKAVTAANELVDAERSAGFSAALLRSLRWSSVPLKFVGDNDGAMAALEEAHAHAERLRLAQELWHIAEYVTDLAFEQNNVDLAREWTLKCAAITAQQSPTSMQQLVTAHALARVAVMQGDFVDAQLHFRECMRVLPKPVIKTRSYETLLATGVLIGVHVGLTSLGRRQLSKLRRSHLQTREWGFRDYEAGALVTALRATGQDSDARQLRDQYVGQFRRSRLPLPPPLQPSLSDKEIEAASGQYEDAAPSLSGSRYCRSEETLARVAYMTDEMQRCGECQNTGRALRTP